jgi:eukaryotic-like serine/threonine-protein kinase
MDSPENLGPQDHRRTLPTVGDANAYPADGVTIPDFQESVFDVPTLPEGTKIGKYIIETVLGVGGMGAVYRARQNKPKRLVALKLIRPGVLSSKSIRRFDLEAEILGRLHHPNIAQIYEAGIDAETGSPYFAMEYVDGQELGDYIREHSLSIHDRLELFVKLCDAIQHAHAKGIIHRDLKPGNVIVSNDGEPKVLDFGIARATDSTAKNMTLQTNVGQLIGTLYYMSPEQAIGQTLHLDTRSDVYALGVVLYELLTGEIPYSLKDKALHEAVRIIQESKPIRMNRHDPSLKGDIEIIVFKSLDKDREQRYQSVAEFSADIRRMLGNMPIMARPPSMYYRTSKFVRRNTGLTVAAACIVVIFGVATGIAGTQWVRRIEARQIVLDNMLTALNEMDVQKGLGPDLSKRLLDLYSENGETLFSGDRKSLALFYTNLGEAYFGYEDYASALSSYNKAYRIRVKEYDSPHPMIADALHKIANAEFYLDDYAQARVHYEQTLEMYLKLYQPTDPGSSETARTLDHLGSTLVKLGDNEGAIEMYTRAKDLRVQLFGAGSLEVAMSNNSIAWYYIQQNKYEAAEPIYREALELLRALPEDESKPVWMARAMHSLGNTLIHLKRYDEAETILVESLNLKEVLLSNNKPSVALTLQSLAEAYYHLGQYKKAEQYALRVVGIREEINDPKLASTKDMLRVIQSKIAE